MKSQKSQVPKEATRPPIPKPKSAKAQPAIFLDSDFFPADLRGKLETELRNSSLDQVHHQTFIDCCAELAHERLDGRMSIEKKVVLPLRRDEMLKITDKAKALLSAINLASLETMEALRSRGDELMFVSNPAIELPPSVKQKNEGYGAFFSDAWDYVRAIEAVAGYAASKIQSSRQDKPAQEIARGLVKVIAREFQNVTGSLPPDTRASWFAKFMALIANHYRIPCGPRIIRGAIADLRAGDTMIS